MGSIRFSRFLSAAVAALAFASLCTSARASKEQVIYNFTGGSDGGNAATSVVFDASGNAYGTTVVGGDYGCGTAFQLTPVKKNWHETVLHSFTCYSDGKNPHGGVTLGPGGGLYGTTVAGGTGYCVGDGCGVVFFVAPSSFFTLYQFQGGYDGWGPGSAVIFDGGGDVFGTTPDGGQYGVGTVYELLPRGSGWIKQILHDFTGGKDGGTGSLGPLLMDASGSLYGVTETGGKFSAGTAYKLSQSGGKWKFQTIYQFRGMPDAGSPYGGLIGDGQGNLYGTTYYGGKSGLGSVFELSPNAKGYKERVLHSFAGNTDGSSPTTTLLFDASGNMYGTTSAGGNPSCDCGTVFELFAGSKRERVLHVFGNTPDGAYPYYGLTAGPDGRLYGSTVGGGVYGQGTIFALKP